jgi:hypothetical protein
VAVVAATHRHSLILQQALHTCKQQQQHNQFSLLETHMAGSA